MKVKFVLRDILDTPSDFYIANAVTADFNGNCSPNEKILFLVDKPIQSNGITVGDMKIAFKRLKEVTVEKGIDKIAMPMVGTGRNGLDWDTEVFPAFCEVFDDTDIYFEVCVLSEDKVREYYDSKPNADEVIIDNMVDAMVDGYHKTDIIFGAAKELVKNTDIPIRDAFDKVEGLYERAVERFTSVSRDAFTTSSEGTASSHYTINSATADKQFMDLINKITK